MKFLIGSYTKKSSQGIYSATLDANGIQTPVLHMSADNPTYLAKHSDFLFSVVKAGSEGGIAVSRQGQLINQVVEAGAPPCFVSYDAKNQLVYSANYHGGRINSYRYDETKGLSDVQRIVFPEGSKAHYIAYVPQLDEVLVCDLGLDSLYFYKAVGDQLVQSASFNSGLKTGARHLVVHPTRPLIYLFTELSSEVLVLKRTKDGVEMIERHSALPEGVSAQKWGAAIRLSPDARFLYVSNRGHDSISVFALSEDGEHIRLIQNIPSEGIQPRDFNLSPDGANVVVANLDSDSLTLFDRDAKTGLMTLKQKGIWAPEPVCILFEE